MTRLPLFLLLLLQISSAYQSLENSEKDPALALYQNLEVSPPEWHPSPKDPKALTLWPDGDIPGERPETIGKEYVKCGNANCTDRHIYNVTTPTLLPFLVDSSDSAMIVAPGGGYFLLAYDREGIRIAQWLNSIGISAFVLKYRVPSRHWLSFGAAPLMDAQRAMGMVRGRNYTKVGFMGFSAGGHLTGHLNVAWSNRTYHPIDALDSNSCRPDFSIMVYPWRSVSQPPVLEPISGASALNVTQDTPPTLLVQTQDDPVHVENSIFYYLALKNASVSPSELHVYPYGGHGYGNCPPPWPHREVCTWTERAEKFLETVGVAAERREFDVSIE